MKWKCAYKALSLEIRLTKALFKRQQRRITVSQDIRHRYIMRLYVDGDKEFNCLTCPEYDRSERELRRLEGTAGAMLVLLSKAKIKGFKMLSAINTECV